MTTNAPCLICGREKGQPPTRCNGHYEVPGQRRRTYSPEQSADIEAKLAAKDAEIERLKAEAVEDDEELERIITYAKRIKRDAHSVYEVIDTLTTALCETREALEGMVIVMDRGPSPRKLDEALTWRRNDEAARAKANEVLAKYADLAGEEQS